MLCRLRLLRRFSSLLQITPQFPTSVQNLSSRTGFNQISGKHRSLFCRRATAKRRQGGSAFCTRATEMEEAAGSALSAPYLSVRIRCRRDITDTFSEALLSFGANSTSVDKDENSENSDETWITSIFTDDRDVHACISHAANSIGLNDIPNYEVSTGEPCDWITAIQLQLSYHINKPKWRATVPCTIPNPVHSAWTGFHLFCDYAPPRPSPANTLFPVPRMLPRSRDGGISRRTRPLC